MLYLNGLILFIFSFAMFWLLVGTWQDGAMTTGDFVLIISLYAQITGTLMFIGRAFNATSRALGEMREGLDDLVLPHEITDASNAEKMSVQRAKSIGVR